MASYFRSYELIISPLNGDSLMLFQDRDNPGLAVEFNIQKSDTEQPNPAVVKIYNPNEKTIASIQRGVGLKLDAGYHGDISTILIGQIGPVSVGINGYDVVVEIEVDTRPQAKIEINKTMGKGTTNVQIIEELVKHIIDNVQEVNGRNPYAIVEIQAYKYAVTLSGDPYELLLKYLGPIGYTYIVDNGLISIVKSNGFLLDSSVTLSATSGMIGSPKKIKEKIKGTEKDRKGVEVKSILNYNFAPKRILNLISKEVNGQFTISSVTFAGNSFSGDWSTTVRAFTNEL